VSNLSELDVAVDGSVYHKYKNYKDEMQKAINKCVVTYKYRFGM
jgi:hypothetical protein